MSAPKHRVDVPGYDGEFWIETDGSGLVQLCTPGFVASHHWDGQRLTRGWFNVTSQPEVIADAERVLRAWEAGELLT